MSHRMEADNYAMASKKAMIENEETQCTNGSISTPRVNEIVNEKKKKKKKKKL